MALLRELLLLISISAVRVQLLRVIVQQKECCSLLSGNVPLLSVGVGRGARRHCKVFSLYTDANLRLYPELIAEW